jgi:hypothetical protein
MPNNVFLVPLIHLLWPGAHIIHLRRNRVDNALSIYFQNFNGRLLPCSTRMICSTLRSTRSGRISGCTMGLAAHTRHNP